MICAAVLGGLAQRLAAAELAGDQHEAAGVAAQNLDQLLDFLAALQVGARARDPAAFAQHVAHQLECLARREPADIELRGPGRRRARAAATAR